MIQRGTNAIASGFAQPFRALMPLDVAHVGQWRHGDSIVCAARVHEQQVEHDTVQWHAAQSPRGHDQNGARQTEAEPEKQHDDV